MLGNNFMYNKLRIILSHNFFLFSQIEFNFFKFLSQRKL